jgi:hypothetical protein
MSGELEILVKPCLALVKEKRQNISTHMFLAQTVQRLENAAKNRNGAERGFTAQPQHGSENNLRSLDIKPKHIEFF